MCFCLKAWDTAQCCLKDTEHPPTRQFGKTTIGAWLTNHVTKYSAWEKIFSSNFHTRCNVKLKEREWTPSGQWISGCGLCTTSSSSRAYKLDRNAHRQAHPHLLNQKLKEWATAMCLPSQVNLMSCYSLRATDSMNLCNHVKYTPMEEYTRKDKVVLSVIGLWLIFPFPCLSSVVFIYATFSKVNIYSFYI